MKFVFTGDLHLSKYGQDLINHDSALPERLNSIKSVLNQMAKYCIDNNISTIIIGGDLLHGKSIIYAIAQKIMLDYFRSYPQITFYVIDGNHDLSGKGSDAISALLSLNHEPNVRRIDNTHEMLENILFVPYSFQMVSVIKNSKADILISHFGLNEGILNSGISIVADIAIKDLIGKYKLVLLGHYHKPQEIINDNINLYYAGSPIQLDWGEKNEEKRFLVVDTETLQVESILTAGYKKYLEYEITEDNKQEIIERAHKDQESGNYVKVVKKDKIELGDNINGLQIVDKSEVNITNRGVSTNMSKMDILRQYVISKEIPQNEIEEYINTVKQLVEGV